MGRHIRKSTQCAFFTKPEIAKRLIDETQIERFKLIIEPSAGDGSFSKQIENCKAFDIDPKHPSIIACDFLRLDFSDIINTVPGRKDILCIGNPPFGPNGSLALAFIKKCTEIADTIAFILPLSYKKESMQARIPEYYHLVKQIDLPLENALLNGEPQKVPVVFQIWENKHCLRPRPIKFAPVGFWYVDRENADFCVRRVGARAGRASRELSKSRTAHYYIRLWCDKLVGRTIDETIDVIINKLNEFDWDRNNTVGQRSISKNELNKAILSIRGHAINPWWL